MIYLIIKQYQDCKIGNIVTTFVAIFAVIFHYSHCGQRPQYSRGYKKSICGLRLSQFIVTKGHNI